MPHQQVVDSSGDPSRSHQAAEQQLLCTLLKILAQLNALSAVCAWWWVLHDGAGCCVMVLRDGAGCCVMVWCCRVDTVDQRFVQDTVLMCQYMGVVLFGTGPGCGLIGLAVFMVVLTIAGPLFPPPPSTALPCLPLFLPACTCCYDEIKGIQDLKIYSHADSLILSVPASFPACVSPSFPLSLPPWVGHLPFNNLTLTLALSLTITCTCCYDEIKRTQDLSRTILILILRFCLPALALVY